MTVLPDHWTTLAVGDLARWVHRSGDLHGRLDRKTNAREGVALHRRLETLRSEDWDSEVAIETCIDDGEFCFRLRGRADAVCEERGCLLIEEVKSTRAAPERAAEQEPAVHLAQVKLYGAILAAERGFDSIRLRLRYVHVDDYREFQREETCSAAELAQFLTDTIHAWADRLRALVAWQALRGRCNRDAELPYGGLRSAQREFAASIWAAQQTHRVLLAEAPTGTGKSLGMLLPAVRGLDHGHHDRVWFVTARNSGRAAAYGSIEALRESGFRIRTLTIAARDDACINAETTCDPELCQYARGYFDRAPAAVDALIAREHATPQVVREVAVEHGVCPFELSLDASIWMDVVVADYNYVFDPVVRLLRLRPLRARGLLLVDEAHQLDERVRGMYSASLTRDRLRAAEVATRGAADELSAAFRRLLRAMSRAAGSRQATEETWEAADPSILFRALERAASTFESWLAGGREIPPAALDAWFEVWRMRRLAGLAESADVEQDDGSHVLIAHREGRSLDSLHWSALESGPFAGTELRGWSSAVLCSATLLAGGAPAAELGLGQEAATRRFGSSFPTDHLLVQTICDIPTQLRHREQSLPELIACIRDVVSARAGNYLLFAPSWAYLELLVRGLEREQEARPFADLCLQPRGRDTRARDAFLEGFRDPDEPLTGGAVLPLARQGQGASRLGLAVLGGVFGESVDLVGERLIGVIVVGIGLPPPQLLQRMRERHLGPQGYATVFQRPAMQKVLQAGGRVIRSATDRGTVTLIDPRLRDPSWRACLPPHWQVVSADSRGAGERARTFWSQSSDVGVEAKPPSELTPCCSALRPVSGRQIGAAVADRSAPARDAPVPAAW